MILLRNFGIDGATFVAVLSLIVNGVQMWIGMKKDAASNELAKLKENNNFIIEPIDTKIFGDLKFENNNGMITLFPGQLNDGFFMSKLKRI